MSQRLDCPGEAGEAVCGDGGVPPEAGVEAGVVQHAEAGAALAPPRPRPAPPRPPPRPGRGILSSDWLVVVTILNTDP